MGFLPPRRIPGSGGDPMGFRRRAGAPQRAGGSVGDSQPPPHDPAPMEQPGAAAAGPESDPAALVRLAREGDRSARETLLRSYAPFALRVASRTCGRYVAMGQDDEANVALLAFNEAIDGYRPDKGRSFLGFAETVIRRRLIDHFRGQKAGREVPLSDLEVEDEEGGVYCPAEMQAAVARHEAAEEGLERRDEILRYQRMLAEFGITLQELARISPRHRDAREGAQMVARRIAANAAYVSHLRSTRSLPLRELEREGLPVSRKTMERNRKYIIAVTLILVGDFAHLKSYIGGEGGCAG